MTYNLLQLTSMAFSCPENRAISISAWKHGGKKDRRNKI